MWTKIPAPFFCGPQCGHFYQIPVTSCLGLWLATCHGSHLWNFVSGYPQQYFLFSRRFFPTHWGVLLGKTTGSLSFCILITDLYSKTLSPHPLPEFFPSRDMAKFTPHAPFLAVFFPFLPQFQIYLLSPLFSFTFSSLSLYPPPPCMRNLVDSHNTIMSLYNSIMMRS